MSDKQQRPQVKASHDFTFRDGVMVCQRCGMRRIVGFIMRNDGMTELVFEHPGGERECVEERET